MIYKPKGRKHYRIKFQWQGKTIQQRTQVTTARAARLIEAEIRLQVKNGKYQVARTQSAVTCLADFLRKDFMPFNDTKFAAKPKSRKYYEYGMQLLLGSDVARLRLDEVTSQHAAGFEAKYSHLSPSSINCGLRTLRRALNLAVEWGKLTRGPAFKLAKGERQRDRILTEQEFAAYAEVCRQPWRDVATLLYGTAMRPAEAYALRWEHVLLNGSGGLIQIAEGKSKAARRLLPMVHEVYQMLRERSETQGTPSEGWVFPSGSASGHLEQNSAKNQHLAAVRTLKGIKPFPPYCLRHTALTRLAEAGADAFTLAKIAGHSSVTITQRYIHPEAESVERAFQNRQNLRQGQKLVPTGGPPPKNNAARIGPNDRV